jgi:hypothetical protein
MHGSDRLYLSKFTLSEDFGSLFEEDDIQDVEYDRDINLLLDGTDFDQADDYFLDED